MSQAGSENASSNLPGTLKRRRCTSDGDEISNMPPKKKSPCNDSSYTEDNSPEMYPNNLDDVTECLINTKSPPSEPDFSADDILSSPDQLDAPSSVLSQLDCVSRGDSTPHSNKRKRVPPPPRKCPFPSLTWADPESVWKRMCDCDVRSTQRRDPAMFARHPMLQPRMRAILLDWLNEVCEVYKMHRETFHLTVDYVDRFLANTADMDKSQLQLLGITSLFIAAKVEEVYPPKIKDFAYVTDGACTEEDILLEEVCVLKVLSWSITPITTNEWLNVYMQLSGEARCAKKRLIGESNSGVNSLRGYTFVLPQYSSLEFALCAQLIDLAVLHVEVVMFPYSVVAAAVFAHAYNKELAQRVSGYRWEDISDCYYWLRPFVSVVREEGEVSVPRDCGGEFVQRSGGLALICPDINLDESHRIQVHNINLAMFDKVCSLLEDETPKTAEKTPLASTSSTDIASPLTPPQSDQKNPALLSTQGPTPSTSGRGLTVTSDKVE